MTLTLNTLNHTPTMTVTPERACEATPRVWTRRSRAMTARALASEWVSRSVARRTPRASTSRRDGWWCAQSRRASRAGPRALDDGARGGFGGFGGFGSGGGDDGSRPGSRFGDDDDGGDEEEDGVSRRFNARVKFFVGAVVLHWTTMRAIAWNDRAVYDDDTDEDWSRKRVSIVIPARNESKAIGTVLRLVSLALEPEAAEIIVSVGDSSDDTADIARSHGAIVVSGEKGRGNQMNAGARVATGGLYFVLTRRHVAAGGRRGRHSSTASRSKDRHRRFRIAHRDAHAHVLGNVLPQRRQDDVLRRYQSTICLSQRLSDFIRRPSHVRAKG